MKKEPRMCAIVDVETTGLDPGKHVVIEVAVVTYDLVDSAILGAYSTLVHRADAVRGGNPARQFNGIDPAWLTSAPTQERVWPEFLRTVSRAEVFVAHRASFDCGFLPKSIREALPWACTKYGVKWPCGTYAGHLSDLVKAHADWIGKGFVPQRHRALGDCLMIVDLFEMARELGFDVRASIAAATGVLERRDPPPEQRWTLETKGAAE